MRCVVCMWCSVCGVEYVVCACEVNVKMCVVYCLCGMVCCVSCVVPFYKSEWQLLTVKLQRIMNGTPPMARCS